MTTGKRKNYYDVIGEEYGLLRIVGIMPRKYKKNGHLDDVRVQCECRCGRKYECYYITLTQGQSTSCGKCIKRTRAKKQKLPVDPIHSKLPRDKKYGKYECKYFSSECALSEVLHICCCECEKYKSCVRKCTNKPELCGAKKR